MVKSQNAPTLSKHLLNEANRFLTYPVRARRTRLTLATQQVLDDSIRLLLDWRKTFVPEKYLAGLEVLWSKPVLLDQACSRQLLEAVPEMVERTLALRSLTFAGISDDESLSYLREAANSYIMGLPLATVALSRAAVERALRHVCGKYHGAPAVDAASLDELIDRYARGVLSRPVRDQADKVRREGNAVLHRRGGVAPSIPRSLLVLEAARDVLRALQTR